MKLSDVMPLNTDQSKKTLRLSDVMGDSTPQGESGDDWMSKSFPKTARNNLSKLYQGGANSPALKKAQYDVESAKSRTNPVMTTLKGLSDTADQINKVVPFGDRKQTLNPTTPQGRANIAGESLKAASFIPGVGVGVGAAAYGAGMGVEDQKKSVGGAALETGVMTAGGKAFEYGLPLAVKAIKYMTPKPVQDRIYDLYKGAVNVATYKFKVPRQIEEYKNNFLSSVSSIIKNKSNLKFENPATGDVYSKPKTQEDFLAGIEKTQKDIFSKYNGMSKGATDKGALIDTAGITKKSLSGIVNDKNLRFVSPSIVKEAEDMIANAGELGHQTPEQVEDLLTKINNKTAVYWANQDKNGVNAMVKLSGALRENMEKTIEDSLERGGYLEARKEYGALKAIKKDVLNAVARKVFKGDATIGDKLLDTFAGEELVRAIVTLNPHSLVTAGTTKSYQLLRQFMRNPDRKIAKMFELADKHFPQDEVLEGTYAAAHNPTRNERPQQFTDAEIMAKRLQGRPQATGIGYQTKALPDKSWMNSEKTSVRPQPKFEGDETQKPIYAKGEVQQKPKALTFQRQKPNWKSLKPISEGEAGSNPLNEEKNSVILSPEDIQRDKEIADIKKETQKQMSKSAQGFLRDIRGKISSEYAKKGHFLEEEFRSLKQTHPAAFSPKGMPPDVFASEIAAEYPEFFNYKDPHTVTGEELVRAIDLAKRFKGGK
jgi:hypothetical protein